MQERRAGALMNDFLTDVDFIKLILDQYSAQSDNLNFAGKISTTIRKMANESVEKLGIKKQISFMLSHDDFIDGNTTNFLDDTPLTMMRVTQAGAMYLPKYLCKQATPVGVKQYNFHTWWAEQYVLKTQNRKFFTRKQIVVDFLANKREAHMDTRVLYPDLEDGTLGWCHSHGDVSNVAMAIVLQVGYELYTACNQYLVKRNKMQ